MSVRRILQRHENTLDALQARLEEIPDALWTWRASPEAWSPAEVYDHVGRIARLYSFPKLEACLCGEGRPGGGRTQAGFWVLALPWLAGCFRHQRSFPVDLQPQAISKAEARRMLKDLRTEAQALAVRVEADEGIGRAEHVRLGWLNAREWFAFAEFHHRHHLKGQLRRILASWAQSGQDSPHPSA